MDSAQCRPTSWMSMGHCMIAWTYRASGGAGATVTGPLNFEELAGLSYVGEISCDRVCGTVKRWLMYLSSYN